MIDNNAAKEFDHRPPTYRLADFTPWSLLLVGQTKYEMQLLTVNQHIQALSDLAVDKSQQMHVSHNSISRQLSYRSYALTREDWTSYICTYLHKCKIRDAGMQELFDLTIRFGSTCTPSCLVSFSLLIGSLEWRDSLAFVLV